MARARKTARRTAGSGQVVYEKARRRWRGRVVQADGSVRTVTAPTKEDAVQKLNTLLGIGQLSPAEDRQLTVEKWLRHWMDNVAPGRARSTQTVTNDRWAVENYLIPRLGRRKLAALSTEDVENMLIRLSKDPGLTKQGREGLSRNSLIRVRSTLGKALDEAIRRNRITHNNVARFAVLPMDARRATEGRSLSVEEAKRLLAAAALPTLPPKPDDPEGAPRGNDNGALVVVGLMLGLRPGELMGLVWDNVDFDNNELRIDKALVRGPQSKLTREEPKTKKSRRVVGMPAPVADALLKHRDRQTVRSVDPELDFVFKTAAGTPVDPSNLRRYFFDLCEAAGIGDWTPKELRHSAASLLSAAGVPIDQAADLLGHADTRMLDRHYRHKTTRSYNAAVGPMEEMFGG
jgi:integrase